MKELPEDVVDDVLRIVAIVAFAAAVVLAWEVMAWHDLA